MEVRTREDVLRELIARARESPHGWKAAVRRDPRLFADEYYIFHPKAGLYEVKEYQVNPFEASGVGAHLGPEVPDDLQRLLEGQTGVFGILEVDVPRLLEVLEEISEGISLPEAGVDPGIHVPLRGPAHGMPPSLRFPDTDFDRKRRAVDAEFRKLLDRRGLTRAYA